MPELAEVEFFRKRWDLAARGEQVVHVAVHAGKKVFRGTNAVKLAAALEGKRLEASEARAKQMLFRFSGGVWLGLHLGMSGELSVASREYSPGKHDHLVIETARGAASPRDSSRAHRGVNPLPPLKPTNGHALVFSDPRMFGRVLLHIGPESPDWWTKIAPDILSPGFTVAAVTAFLQRRRKAPIKAVLLMQERFPGIGNWMADEVLWRAGIHPARPAGTLTDAEIRTLWRECRRVCRQALAAIAGRGRTLPPDLNVNIPRTWLFKHRWRPGGKDPLLGTPLAHANIGGRTTCWSPAKQKERQAVGCRR